MKTRDIDRVLQLLKSKKGVNFSGTSHVENGIGQRIKKTDTVTCQRYYDFISTHPEECDQLVQALTIHVSSFFRDPLTFDYLSEIIYPKILGQKSERGEREFRVWSTGCASGEEPYSIAIGLKELPRRVSYGFDFYIFGTDIRLFRAQSRATDTFRFEGHFAA